MTGTVDETARIDALRKGDETAFAQLVDEYATSMLRVARGYVRAHEIGEELIQETWIALVQGITKFEGRSSLRTWRFAVMINIAKARGIPDRRDADRILRRTLRPHLDHRGRCGAGPRPGIPGRDHRAPKRGH